MTWIKSQLFAPDGTPIEGCCVTATLVPPPGWLNDATGRVTSRAVTHSDSNGLWRLNLVPITHFEESCAYRVVETCTDAVWHIHVPENIDEDEELWLRDLLVPNPTPQQSSCLNTVQRLADLVDVDRQSLAAAVPGDRLVLLPSGKWGAEHSAALTLHWQPVNDNLAAVTATVLGFSTAGVRLDWGDGTTTDTTSTDPVGHTYTDPGVYTITATDLRYPALTASDTVTIKDRLHQVQVFIDGDDDWTALVWLNEPEDDTDYLIDWGDDTVDRVRGQQRVPPRPRVAHQYSAAARWVITVTDTDTKRVVTCPINTGEIGVMFTYDPNLRPRSWCRWLKTGAEWVIDRPGLPDPLTGTVPASGIVTTDSDHDFTPGVYAFTLHENVDGIQRRRAYREFNIPTVWDWRLQVEMTWATSPDKTSQTVTITPHGARTTCLIDWGDDSDPGEVEPTATVSHTYSLPTPAEGRLLRITETGVDDARVFQRLLAAPRLVGQPVLNARGRRTVDLHVAGVDSPANADWYQVRWGDGTDGDGADPVDQVGAVGRWYPASHTYARDGDYTITVDAPGMVEPEIRTVTVATYPSPKFLVSEARTVDGAVLDPERRTIRVLVDNTESGGPCTIDFGDGSVPRVCAETDDFTFRYPRDGSYVLVCHSNTDPTAKDRAEVTVPFGTPSSLRYELGRGADEWTVLVRITAFDPAKQVVVDWGHQGLETVVGPSGEASHQYPPFEAAYGITVRYSDSSEAHDETVDLPIEPPQEARR